MTQLGLFESQPATATSALRTRRTKKDDDQPRFDPPAGPERESDADEFESRLVGTVRLRPYQSEAARWLDARQAGILADEPGVGKTASLVAALPVGAPVVVVCPAVARDGVWPRHLAWRPDLRVRVCRRKDDFLWPPPGVALVVNYEGLPAWLDLDEVQPPRPCTVVILDEGHLAKNPGAIRGKRARRLCEAARESGGRSWVATGHPLKNKPLDLWHLLGVAGLQEATWRTERRFCRAFGVDTFTRQQAGPVEAEVPEVLRRVMLRREFSEVVRDMPPRQWEELEVEIDPASAAACTAAVEALRAAGVDLATATRETLADAKKNKAAGEFMRARATLAAAKTVRLLELVEEHEEASDRPLVVFSAHRAPLLGVATRPGWRKLTGDESPSERAELEASFQRGELRGLAITIGPVSTAISLSRARRAIFVDRGWTLADNEQAEGRIYRADEQTRGTTEPVTYTILVADHPIDRTIAALLRGKREVTDASVGAASVRVGDAGSLPVATVRCGSCSADTCEHVETVGGARQSGGTEREPTATQKTTQPAPKQTTEIGQRETNPLKRWATESLLRLAAGKDVSAFDRPLLLALLRGLESGLDEARWGALVKVCRRYARVLGDPPST